MPYQRAHSRRTASSRKQASDSSVLANLEPIGERRKVISLHTLLTNKKRPETRDAARLGDVLLPWFEKSVARPAAKLELVAELWQEHVPPTIVRHCRLAGFYRGTLTVVMDSAAVRAELETRLRSGLLRVLQTGSRGALFRVKTSIEGYLGKE
jgi:predicted nucleic acid-binding Zn ribbon protein